MEAAAKGSVPVKNTGDLTRRPECETTHRQASAVVTAAQTRLSSIEFVLGGLGTPILKIRHR